MHTKTKIILTTIIALLLVGVALFWWLRTAPFVSELVTVAPDDVGLVLDRDNNKLSDFLDSSLRGQSPTDRVPVVITTKSGFDTTAVTDLGAAPLIPNVFIAQFDQTQLSALSGLDAVLIVEEDQVVRGQQAGDLGGFGAGGASDGQPSENPGRAPPRVAVLDSGVDTSGPLVGASEVVGWYDAVNGQGAPYDDEVITGQHGTKVTSVILEDSPDSTEIVAVKVLDDQNRGQTSDLIEGLSWVSSNAGELNIRVVNISAAFPNYSYAVEQMINELHDKGVVIVAAAGNNSGGVLPYPAAYENVISVGAYDVTNEQVADFSNYSKNLDVVADGVDVWVERNGQRVYIGSGTSFAAPDIIDDILQLIDRGVTDPEEIRRLLKAAAQDVGQKGADRQSGSGLVVIGANYDDIIEDLPLPIDGPEPGDDQSEPIDLGDIPPELEREIAGAALRERYVMTLIGNGKDRTAAGQFAVGYEEWVDPNARDSEEAGTMARHVLHYTGGAVPRYGHTMTLLNNGKVLVAGGVNGIIPLQSAALYNPETRSFEPTDSGLTQARAWHSATSLPSGDVLILGGYGDYDPADDGGATGPFVGASGRTPGTEGSFYKAYQPAIKSRLPLRSGEVYVTRTNKFVTLSEYFRLSEEPLMSVGRAYHTATLVSSKRKVLILGGVTGEETGTTSATQQGSVLISLSSDKSLLAKGETAELVFVLRDSNPPSGRWSRKTKVTLKIDGPARFRDVDPTTGKVEEDAGLVGNVTTAEFYLYPGSLPWKYRLRLVSSVKAQDLGGITVTGSAIYLGQPYQRSINIARDHTLEREATDESTLKERGKSLIIDFSSDKDLLGRAEFANLSVVIDDNRDNDLPRFAEAQGSITIDGPARLWVTDTDLGKNIGHPDTSSDNQFNFTLNPKFTPNRLPYYPGVPQLRLLSYFENQNLGNITVTLSFTYDNTHYERKLTIKRDHTKSTRVENDDEENGSSDLKQTVSYSIKADQEDVAYQNPAQITVRMEDTRDIKNAYTRPATIHMVAQGAISLVYMKGDQYVTSKTADLTILPRLTPKVARVSVVRSGGDADLSGVVSVQITYDGEQYPSRPKFIPFNPLPIDNVAFGDAAPEYLEYSFSSNATVLAPGERTEIELIFREKREVDHDAPARILVDGNARLEWRGQALVDLQTDLQPGVYYWKIRADLVSDRRLPEEDEVITLISTVQYEGRTYRRSLSIKRNPSDEAEYVNMLDSISPGADSPDLVGSSIIFVDPAAEDIAPQSQVVSAETERVGVLTRAWRDLVRMKPQPTSGLATELFMAKNSTAKFELLPQGLSGITQHAAVALDDQLVLIASRQHGIVLYDGRKDHFYEVGDLGVTGDITYALHRSVTGVPVMAYLFGSTTSRHIQVVNLGDFSTNMVQPDIAPESTEAIKRLLGSQYRSGLDHFGGFSSAVRLTGNRYLLTASDVGSHLSFIYDLDSNVARAVADTRVPVYQGPTAFIEHKSPNVQNYGPRTNILATDLWDEGWRSALPAQHAAVSLGDGTALAYGGQLDVEYSFDNIADFLFGGGVASYADPIENLDGLIKLKETLFDRIYSILNDYSFTPSDVQISHTGHNQFEADGVGGYGRFWFERADEWLKTHRVSGTASYAAFLIDVAEVPEYVVVEPDVVEDDEVVGSSNVGGQA